jgi:hypothetical protein
MKISDTWTPPRAGLESINEQQRELLTHLERGDSLPPAPAHPDTTARRASSEWGCEYRDRRSPIIMGQDVELLRTPIE